MYNFRELEPEIREYWKGIELLKKLMQKNRGNKKFFLLDGPPYANDIPHIGHIRNTVYKDLIIRLRFMQGYDVLFQPGFDTHGLPVENKVEKKLNLKSKKDILKIGVNRFTALCKELAATNKDLWMNVYDILGSWYSWKEPYLTYENYYIESGWWTFKELWKKGIVYEGKKPVHWCPYCQTALAGYEVTDSYKMVSDPSIFVAFKIEGKNEFFLVYTTTPWTLLSNEAIAAKADEDYAKVETDKGILIVAKERLKLLTELGIKYKIKYVVKGEKLNGIRYEPVIDVPLQKELHKNPNVHKVYMSIPIMKARAASKIAVKKKTEAKDHFEHFVAVDEGTGLVHCAPGHGKTDNEVGQHYGLPEASPLDDECRYTDDAGKFKGMFVKDADSEIVEELKRTGNLLHHSHITHKYPLCWRCKAPLIFRMSNQWFFRIGDIKDIMLNAKVGWYPKFAEERFHSWVLDAEDWNVSRQRYYGIPIPIWVCGSCSEKYVIGSLKELKERAVENVSENFDLHNANNIRLRCRCKGIMTRISDITDVWFDSGIAPWASLGYPFRNRRLFTEHFPVDRVNESQDQIRGWFYSLMFCGAAAFGKAPYKTVSMPGWVVDEKGEKMSKSVGNVIYAKEALEEVGADILRFYMCWDVAPYALQRFNKETAKKEVGKIMNIVWNMQNLVTSSVKRPAKLETEDRWIISRMNSVIKDYTGNLENFELHLATRQLADFMTESLSRWYIHLVRERLNENDSRPLWIIKECLLTSAKLMAPVAPYIAEKLYQNLGEKNSVHLAAWPKHNTKLIDQRLEENMELVKGIIQEILARREKAGLGVRWPLKSAEITTENPGKVRQLADMIKRQANIKDVIVRKGRTGVKLDTRITKELEMEGYAREVMRHVQSLRKKLAMKKSDRVRLAIVSDYNVSGFGDAIKKKVGAVSISFKEEGYKHGIKLKIKGKDFEVLLEKV